MPRGSWLGLLVCVVAVSPAMGQGSPRPLPQLPQASSPPSLARTSNPPGPPATAEPHVKDLTPSEFGDLIPPPDPHASGHCVPGHLTPTVPDHAGFYGTAEYLLFRPRSSSFDYALLNATPGLATVGPIRSLNYDLGSGIRAELGYHFCGGWDAAFMYTYFQGGGSTSTTATGTQVILPTLTRPGLTDNALFASAAVNLNYNLYDMVLGKRFAVDDRFAVRGFAGFRFADITQQFSAFYDGLDARAATVDHRSQFSGFGPLIGGEAILGGPSGFHAYARATGGLLTGCSTNQILETNDGGATVYVDSRYNTRKVVPVTSIAIGGGWQYRTVSIRAGYEITQWFGLTEPVRFVDAIGQGKVSTRPSNLSLEGFFVQFGLSF